MSPRCCNLREQWQWRPYRSSLGHRNEYSIPEMMVGGIPLWRPSIVLSLSAVVESGCLIVGLMMIWLDMITCCLEIDI